MGVTTATFTLEHYEHMVACGVFDGKHRKRVELLRGEILEMSPIGPLHADELDRLMQWSVRATSGLPIRVRVQNPVRIEAVDSEPEPDIAWVCEGDYSREHPEPHDVLLVIEVADTSLDYDRGPKLAVYAEAGIPEYWIVNLIDRQVEVHRQPSGPRYEESTLLRAGDIAQPLAAPGMELKLAEVL